MIVDEITKSEKPEFLMSWIMFANNNMKWDIPEGPSGRGHRER